ncbi:peptidase S8/S53 domain-containing protein, partial [Fennellomyces sp. T-0311]
LPGRYLIEFDSNDAQRDSQALLHYLTNKFSDVGFSVPRVLNYDLMRAATLQIDATKGHLHDEVLDAVSGFGPTTKVYPVHAISRPMQVPGDFQAPTSLPNATLLMAHSMTQVDRIHNELHNTGEGIFIAIIDDGIDYLHPALGGGFGEGYKVRYGRDMIGVPHITFDAAGNDNAAIDDDPLNDCAAYTPNDSGHGTHVAGIIGAQAENYTGVAPGATLGMWRVFDCDGGTTEDAIVDAMLDAFHMAPRPDIISMSLGNSNGWSEFITSVTAERIAASGVIVVAAAGNEARNGAFTANSPSVGKGVVSVASIDNSYTLSKVFHITGVEELFLYDTLNGTVGEVPDGQVIYAGHSGACASSGIPSDVRGKIVLVERGNCEDAIKVANLEHAGAVGVLLQYEREVAAETEDPDVSGALIPVDAISYQTGTAVLHSITHNSVAQIVKTATVVPVPTAGQVSSFSSVGPSYENDLAPNIAGIGGEVYSTYPRFRGSWKADSGTSMATPYVSGAFALYLNAVGQNRPSPQYILEQFQNYAHKALVPAEHDYIDSPYRQGAGLIQVYDAIYEKVHVSPGSIAFNDTANLRRTQTFTITNNGDSIVSYEFTNKASVSINPYNISMGYQFAEPCTLGADVARLRFSQKTIKIAPGASASISVTVIPPETDPKLHVMYGGYIELKNTVPNQKDITLPYIGIVGNQRDLPIFGNDSPAITDSVDPNFAYTETYPLTYDRNDSRTQPNIALSLITPSKLIEFPLYDHQGQELGLALAHSVYNPRATNEATYTYFSWDATYRSRSVGLVADKDKPTKTEVAPGVYSIGVRALKLLGDINNPNDWEVWVSSPITV